MLKLFQKEISFIEENQWVLIRLYSGRICLEENQWALTHLYCRSILAISIDSWSRNMVSRIFSHMAFASCDNIFALLVRNFQIEYKLRDERQFTSVMNLNGALI